MTRSRASTAWFLAWAALVLLSFRPIGVLERALELCLAPARVAAELARPLDLVRASRVSAAEKTLASAARAEAAEGAATLAALARQALPTEEGLRAGRRFVPAEVLERPDKDHCRVALLDRGGIVAGCPVVCGNAFVGRVTAVEPGHGQRGLALVELATARTFRVGAVVRREEQEEVFVTVGGLQARSRVLGRDRRVRLAAHQPSSSALDTGLARVHELLAEADEHAQLADGFRLGVVHREGERGPWWVEPELDFLDGLFQLAIVTPADPELAAAPNFEPALGDGYWLSARALFSGDPSPWRSTAKLPLGRASGAREGAAVTGVGARLIGRVLRSGLFTSDVALLADPGFTVVAVAELAGEEGPRILGRLTTLGRGADGAVRMRWWVQVPLGVPAGDGEALRARLFTGSGDPGLPAGLFLGEALLPRSAQAGEEREVLLHPDVDPAALRGLFVRRDPELADVSLASIGGLR